MIVVLEKNKCVKKESQNKELFELSVKDLSIDIKIIQYTILFIIFEGDNYFVLKDGYNLPNNKIYNIHNRNLYEIFIKFKKENNNLFTPLSLKRCENINNLYTFNELFLENLGNTNDENILYNEIKLKTIKDYIFDKLNHGISCKFIDINNPPQDLNICDMVICYEPKSKRTTKPLIVTKFKKSLNYFRCEGVELSKSEEPFEYLITIDCGITL